jgi:hypothetical protein
LGPAIAVSVQLPARRPADATLSGQFILEAETRRLLANLDQADAEQSAWLQESAAGPAMDDR